MIDVATPGNANSSKKGKAPKNEVIELGDSDDDSDSENGPLFNAASSESGVDNANDDDDDMMGNSDFRSSTKLNAVLRHLKALKAKEPTL